MLDKIFKILELKEKHTKVYLTLIETGPTTAGSLSKKLNVSRSTLYGLLYELLKEGLILQSEKNGVKIWQAESPDKLNYKINEKISNLESVKNDSATLISDLKNKRETDFISPKFSYYEGAESLKQMLKDILLYQDIETIAFWPISEMLKILGRDFFIHLNKKRIQCNIHTKVIWPKNKQVNLKENIFLGVSSGFKRAIKIAPSNIDCSMGYWAYENKVAFLSSKKESFGFLVESVELKQLLETQFNVLWNISKPIKPQTSYTKPFLKNLSDF